MSGIKEQFHLREDLGLPADARFSGESVPERMAAAFAVKTACSDFVGEKHVEEGVFARCIRKMSSDAKTEPDFVAAEVVYFDDEVPIGSRDGCKLEEFVLHVPIAVHLCA